jgi:hypothetical protein
MANGNGNGLSHDADFLAAVVKSQQDNITVLAALTARNTELEEKVKQLTVTAKLATPAE